MKKLFLLLFVFLVSIKSNAQSEKVVVKSDSTINSYQYRITFTQVQDNVISSTLVDNMTDFFKTKIDYSKDLNQYIFITDKDMDQYEFSYNFSQGITFFKKILLKSNNIYQNINE